MPDNLQDLQTKVVSLRSQMTDLATAASRRPEGQRNFTTEEETKFDGFKGDLETTKRSIDRLVYLANEQRGNPQNPNPNPNAGIDPNSDNPGGVNPNPLDVNQRDLNSYSVLRAVRCIVEHKPVDGLEGELSKEIARRSGKNPKGFYMYTGVNSAIESRAARLAMERRDVTTSTGAGGITVTVLFQSFIEKLRHMTVVDKVGARFMAGLVGKLYIPRQSGAGTAYWVAESGAPTASNQTLDQVPLAPNTLGAYTDISRQFIEQTSLDAEAFVRDDLAKVLAIEIDRAATNGDGTSDAPTGIMYNSSINHSELATDSRWATVPDAWIDLVGMETQLASADALMGNPAYVTNPKVKGLLKTTLRSSVAGSRYCWDDLNDDKPINGYPAFATNNMPSTFGPVGSEAGGTDSAIIFGDWSSLIIAMWGGLDILVDPYSRSTSGTVRLVALQDTDIKVRHPESFTTIANIAA